MVGDTFHSYWKFHGALEESYLSHFTVNGPKSLKDMRKFSYPDYRTASLLCRKGLEKW